MESYITVERYAKTRITRRGFPTHVSQIYKMISKHRKGENRKPLPFDYIISDGQIWIKNCSYK